MTNLSCNTGKFGITFDKTAIFERIKQVRNTKQISHLSNTLLQGEITWLTGRLASGNAHNSG